MRASDAERDQAISRLRDRFAEGRLSQETFLYRMDAALRAKDQTELSELFADLPEAQPQVRVRAHMMVLRMRLRTWLAVRIARRPRRQAGPSAPLWLPRDLEHRFTIGRALECDLTLADLSVSRWHARLHHEEGGWLLSDLGSTNGTRLNGWRVTTPVEVKVGDQVTFGGLTFVVAGEPVTSA